MTEKASEKIPASGVASGKMRRVCYSVCNSGWCLRAWPIFCRINLKVQINQKEFAKLISFSVSSRISTELYSGTARVLVSVGQNQCQTRAPDSSRVSDTNTVL